VQLKSGGYLEALLLGSAPLISVLCWQKSARRLAIDCDEFGVACFNASLISPVFA
jgi:hypothetical protein